MLHVLCVQMTTQMASMSMGGPRSPGQQQPGYGDLPPPPPELMDQNYSQQHAQPGMYNNILEDFNCLFLNDYKGAVFTEAYALLICESPGSYVGFICFCSS